MSGDDVKIETKSLSKDTLVELVDIIRKETHMLPESLIVRFYRNDLINQVKGISKKYQKIEKELERGKLNIKTHNAKVNELNRLGTAGNKKLAILKELDDASK